VLEKRAEIRDLSLGGTKRNEYREKHERKTPENE